MQQAKYSDTFLICSGQRASFFCAVLHNAGGTHYKVNDRLATAIVLGTGHATAMTVTVDPGLDFLC